MIKSYRDKDKERLATGDKVRQVGAVQKAGREAATCDLAALNSNRLEALKGNRKGQFSIRINDQWRVCF